MITGHMWTPGHQIRGRFDDGLRGQINGSNQPMTGHKPFIKYASFSSGLGLISMEITRITRVQSGHNSLAPHTEFFMRSKSGEESEYIRLGLTRSVYSPPDGSL